MDIRIFPDCQLAAVYAAAMVEHEIKRNSSPVLGLATGSTVIPVYDWLIQLHRWGLSFAHVTTVNLDEYVDLPISHPQSYHSFMHTTLFEKVDIPQNQIFLPNGTATDLQLECKRYDEVIRENPIDLQILGIGVNGHIGFNEPGVEFQLNTHVVALSDETIHANARFFPRMEDVPRQAVTVGIQSIMFARKVVLLAFGTGKAAAIKNLLVGGVRTEWPASILHIHPDVTIILDSAAAQDVTVQL